MTLLQGSAQAWRICTITYPIRCKAQGCIKLLAEGQQAVAKTGSRLTICMNCAKRLKVEVEVEPEVATPSPTPRPRATPKPRKDSVYQVRKNSRGERIKLVDSHARALDLVASEEYLCNYTVQCAKKLNIPVSTLDSILCKLREQGFCIPSTHERREILKQRILDLKGTPINLIAKRIAGRYEMSEYTVYRLIRELEASGHEFRKKGGQRQNSKGEWVELSDIQSKALDLMLSEEYLFRYMVQYSERLKISASELSHIVTLLRKHGFHIPNTRDRWETFKQRVLERASIPTDTLVGQLSQEYKIAGCTVRRAIRELKAEGHEFHRNPLKKGISMFTLSHPTFVLHEIRSALPGQCERAITRYLDELCQEGKLKKQRVGRVNVYQLSEEAIAS